MAEVVSQQWGNDLIKSWNSHSWIDLPIKVGEKIAPIIGAGQGQVICCDSISVNLFKLLCSAFKLNSERTVVLSTKDNFPTDLYMVQGLSDLLGPDLCQLQMVEEQDIQQSLTESVAALLLTQVNFRTGRLLDMAKLTQLAHDKGVLVIWDLAHSAGALPVELDKCEVDFAVGVWLQISKWWGQAHRLFYTWPNVINKRLNNPYLAGWGMQNLLLSTLNTTLPLILTNFSVVRLV